MTILLGSTNIMIKFIELSLNLSELFKFELFFSPVGSDMFIEEHFECYTLSSL